MRNKFRFASIFIMLAFLFSCKNGQENKNNSKTQNAADNRPDANYNAPGNDKNGSEVFRLLQGKWQHVDDKSNYLVFEEDLRKEISGGMDKWHNETFVLAEKCKNNSNKDLEAGTEKDKYISCPDSDLCWYILQVDHESLTLAFMGRGNLLKYRRVD